MTEIPRDRVLDGTVSLMQDGYRFISKRCERYQTDVFETRLMLEKTLCMRGEEAARLFYDEEKFMRHGAAPTRLQKSLFGEGGVQGLDEEMHRRRKEMFMSVMSPEQIEELVRLTRERWEAALGRWKHLEKVVLFYAARRILTRAVCEWAGVPLGASEVRRRTNDFGAMIDGAGGIGVRHWKSRRARARAEVWIGDIIEDVREGRRTVPEDRPLHAVAWHRDANGERLDRHVAAVEMLNFLRPTVAVARYIAFVALALHDHPQYRDSLQSGADEEIEHFVQEVRRYYPFFPFVAARVKESFAWNGYHFPEGVRTILDLYGTNHDPRIWDEPATFRPERFAEWEDDAFQLIPQGGGDHYHQHRCAGEWITIDLMKEAVRLLTQTMAYEVPQQDLRVPLSRIPAVPNSRFVMQNVRPSGEQIREGQTTTHPQ